MIRMEHEQRSEAWFQARAGRVTASNFSDLMMGTTTKGYADLVLKVAAGILGADPEEGYVSYDMQMGNEREPLVRVEYETVTGNTVDEVGLCIPDEDSPFHDFVGASPDGLVGEDGIIEIKCPKLTTQMGRIRAGKFPGEYYWQVQGQLWVTGCKWCDFVSYYPGLKPFICRVLPDFTAFQQLEERLEIFRADVQRAIADYAKYDYSGGEYDLQD